MNARQDPVVVDLNQWINRSAGQHSRRISEGTKSAQRLIGLPVVDTMTDDRFNLHRPVSEQAQEDAEQMEALRKWRESHQPVEFAGPEPYSMGSLFIAVLIVAALCLLVYSISPELRGLISIVTY